MPVAPGEQPTNLWNVLKFTAAHPGSLKVLARKIRKRLTDGHGKYSEAENIAWIEGHAVSSEAIARRVDPALWEEAQAFGRDVRAHAARKLAEVPFDMGAGGEYEFLYWLTRHRRPREVIETGVSSGWSSMAFLTALKRNGGGRLHSSDFPYFRVANPERYVGILVEDDLREGWDLNIDGDENAIPRILAKVEQVDLLHYDSDKSVSGRNFGISEVRRKLAPDGLIVVDDIRNDSWFREYVEGRGEPFLILDGRCGLIGDISALRG